jgi:DNA-binding GntR family transcriptional regulator
VSDAYDQLRALIVSGELQPNERLVEADLAARLGAGRSAVRTALTRLQHDGLIEHERNRGARVRRIGAEEAVQILEARAVLEGLAARRAAERATGGDAERLRAVLADMRALLDAGDLLGASELNARLHRTLIDLAGHEIVDRLVGTLNSQLVRFQYRTILVPGRAERSFAEHTAIVEAVAAGDADAAEAAMRRHLSGTTEALRESVAYIREP